MKTCLMGSFQNHERRYRAVVHDLKESSIIFEVYDHSDHMQNGMSIKDFSLFTEDERIGSLGVSVTGVHNLSIGCGYVSGWIRDKNILPQKEHAFETMLRKSSISEEARRIVGDIETHENTISPQYIQIVTKLIDLLESLKNSLDYLIPDFFTQNTHATETFMNTLREWESSGITFKLERAFQEFEAIAAKVPQESGPLYQRYVHRKLAHLLSESEFLSRAINKPRGYPGDFDTVRYMLGLIKSRDQSLFGELLTRWALKQDVVAAHRNRISLLTSYIQQELERCYKTSSRKKIRLLNLGCGPAHELQSIIKNAPAKLPIDIDLIDFDGGAVQYIRNNFDEEFLKEKKIKIDAKRINVYDYKNRVLKGRATKKYDVIYCAGLIDYRNDNSARSLIRSITSMLGKNGLCIFTNVSNCNPHTYLMRWILDWSIYERSENEVHSLAPKPTHTVIDGVTTDATGVNIFLLIRNAVANLAE